MNKYLLIAAGVLITTTQSAFCLAESVSPELEQSLKTHTGEPGIMSILVALIVVILLIYLTGIIYSKLNIVGAKTLQGHLKNYDLSKVVVLSTTPLGTNRNLHVIELNNRRFLIGATQNSINLIKELGIGDTHKKTQKEIEEFIEPDVDDAIEVLYGNNEEPTLQLKLEPVEEFDLHKKYL